MRKKIFNKRRRKSLIAYVYKLSELLVAGIGLAGLLKEEPDWVVIAWGFTMAVLSFLIGFYLEAEPQNSATPDKPDDS